MKPLKTRKIVLASSSPRRRELLGRTGLKFAISKVDYQEDMRLKLSPKNLAMHLSKGKAQSVAGKHKRSVIISADTFIALEGEVFGKPGSLEDARRILKRLSGKKHLVISGVTVLDTATNQIFSQATETAVYFRKLTPREIEAYLLTGEPLDKAGAYGIQGLGALFIDRIEGDYFNVMGLPLATLSRLLKRVGVGIL